MQPRIVVSALASLALCASVALAQNAPPAPPPSGHMGWHMNKEDMARHHAQMCADIAPRAIGKLAYLQAKLNLTDKQKPLFERWKTVVLGSVKTHADACATMKFPGKDASIVDLAKLKQKMLEVQLADLKAQMPALEALANSLNADQALILKRAALHMAMEHHGMMGHMRGMGDHMRGMFMMHHGGPDGAPGPDDDDAPPPPAD